MVTAAAIVILIVFGPLALEMALGASIAALRSVTSNILAGMTLLALGFWQEAFFLAGLGLLSLAVLRLVVRGIKLFSTWVGGGGPAALAVSFKGHLSRNRGRVIHAAVLLVLGAPIANWAENAARDERLPAQALADMDVFLSSHPSDPRLREIIGILMDKRARQRRPINPEQVYAIALKLTYQEGEDLMRRAWWSAVIEWIGVSLGASVLLWLATDWIRVRIERRRTRAAVNASAPRPAG